MKTHNVMLGSVASDIRFSAITRVATIALCLLFTNPASALGQKKYVEESRHAGNFSIAEEHKLASIYVDPRDYPGVIRAAGDLQSDIARVTNRTPEILNGITSNKTNIILIGTLGKSTLIDRLVADKKIDAAPIAGKWESFLIQVLRNPFPGVESVLVIAGSDKRGTIYGIYDLSEQIGVSPWYWWADVSVEHKENLFVKAGAYVQGPPAVKYRGIFLNDEAPSLIGWVNEKYGGYNSKFYVKVFELLLRLKGNYLWPAMWNSAFNDDDPLNPKLADEYGIVMGTSHHEPMMRAQKEWTRHGQGPWDYARNGDFLRDFWQRGIERNKNYESIITIGMRGDGDMPMSQEANVALLEQIVADQRKIIASVTGRNPADVPQDWALYKEVQEYYEKGMRVPDDVTLLWSDDNWGNIRRVPTTEEHKRAGGAGIYYHFDYVGDPRSYKWLNTIPITKVWEQMNLSYSYGADRIWIVNVGDLKPMEFPIDLFLSLAWNPERWPKESIGEFTRLWAEREFGSKYAEQTADTVSKYTKYNGWRKPELLEPDTFSLVNYQEAERVWKKWDEIVQQAEKIHRELPEEKRAAFFQLVLYPVKASAQIAELYMTVGRNHLYATQGRASTNDLAAKVRALFQADADLSAYYNHTIENGKWNHMMDQSHIGYSSWRDPPANVMPVVKEIDVPTPAQLGVAIEGSTSAWPGTQTSATLPEIDAFNQQSRYIDVFNRGATPFEFTVSASPVWIRLSAIHGTIEKEQRVWVSVDWSNTPIGTSSGKIKIARAGQDPVYVDVSVWNPKQPTRKSLDGFVENNGYVSMEAEHFSAKVDANETVGRKVGWERIADYGRTLSSMTIFPVTAASVMPPENSPRLEYRMYLFDSGEAHVETILAPTLNFVPGRGLRFAISLDDQAPKIIDALADNSQQVWEAAVKDSVRKVESLLMVDKPGYHTLKFWMVDPGVVLQKIVLDFGGVKPSYFGPPESYRGNK